MTRRRWIADEFSRDRAALTGEHAAHLSRTLRARIGQKFEVACGDQVRRATVVSVTEDRVELALGEAIATNAAVPTRLLLAIFKFDRMEWAIEKCTELNVTTIVPVIARRTEKHLAIAAAKRVERWRRIAREAAEQSRRISPPDITDPLKLRDALEQFHQGSAPLSAVIPTDGFSPSGEPALSLPKGICDPPRGSLRIVLAETEREAALAEILRSHQNVAALTLAIGPEGGWAEDELQSFASAQWIAASLGENILRAETAAIVALAITRAEI
jgi:16S rRNA (uracil1498-N3)-methyltransferase